MDLFSGNGLSLAAQVTCAGQGGLKTFLGHTSSGRLCESGFLRHWSYAAVPAGLSSGQGSWRMVFKVTVLVRVRLSCLHSSVGACISGKAADKARVWEGISFLIEKLDWLRFTTSCCRLRPMCRLEGGLCNENYCSEGS